MKRVLLVTSLMMATALFAAPATAASPSGLGTTTIRYRTSAYFDFVLGATVVCKGIHQYGPRWAGDAVSGGRDVYRCRSVSGPFTNVSHDEIFVYEVSQWWSDYFFEAKGVVVPNTRPIRVRISGDGLSYQTIAYYAE